MSKYDAYKTLTYLFITSGGGKQPKLLKKDKSVMDFNILLSVIVKMTKKT